jgi:hypothetical protein
MAIIKNFSVTFYNTNIGKKKKGVLVSLVVTSSLHTKIHPEKKPQSKKKFDGA